MHSVCFILFLFYCGVQRTSASLGGFKSEGQQEQIWADLLCNISNMFSQTYQTSLL